MLELRFVISKISEHPMRFVAIWLVSLWVFLYITSLGLFNAILQDPSLEITDKLEFFAQSFFNVFIYITDLRALSLVIFSLIAAVNFMLMWSVIKRKQKAKQSKVGAIGSVTAMVGAHCAACGGSIIAPFITTIAGSSAYFSTARINTAITISVIVNVIAILIIGIATKKMIQKEIELQKLQSVST